MAFALAVAGLGILAIAIPDRLQIAGFHTPGSASARSTALLDKALGYDPEPGMVVLARSRTRFTQPGPGTTLVALAAEIARDPAVGHVETPFGHAGSRILLSAGGRAALILVHFKRAGEQAAVGPIQRIRSRLRSNTLRLQFGGFDVGFLDDSQLVRTDLLRAELIAFPVLAVLLLLVFRGVAAAVVPLVIGGLTVLGTFASLRLLSQVVDVSVYSLNLASALGLGLAVDYGLFLVSRYREEARPGIPTEIAVRVTKSTAGRAVLYSGATVAGACAALLLFPQPFVYSMGIGGVLTAVFAAGTALVVVPSLLPWVGRHSPARTHIPVIDGTDRGTEAGSWYRFSRWVMRHAVIVAIVSAVWLLALGLPAKSLQLTFLDYHALPSTLQSRVVADAIAREFVPYLEYPITVAISRSTATAGLGERIASLPGAGLVSPIVRSPDGTSSVDVLARGSPLSSRSQGLIQELRGLGLPLLVGGRIADFVDLKASIEARAAPALAVVALATLLVLFLMTDSVVLPVKALLMNSLTIFAVFGVLVAIFQDRVLGIATLLGFKGPAAIETTISVVVVGVTLGLATDYSILLLSRIKEEHDAGRSNEAAVALGLQRSGRVITSAALLLAVALLALASSRVFLVKELAVGLAVGVVIDASIVRACLVPALMRILGRANWWSPEPLHRLRGRVLGLATSTVRLEAPQIDADPGPADQHEGGGEGSD